MNYFSTKLQPDFSLFSIVEFLNYY